MKSFCREFAEKQQIEIDFQTSDLPDAVSPETSICLFRVLQEALHNAEKHSGYDTSKSNYRKFLGRSACGYRSWRRL